MDPPPTPALAAVSSAPHLPTTTDSIESSPRSRTTESWDGPLPTAPGAAPPKLRLMCSHGGHIVPRPHDKSLCYVGGDTRMVFVDRNISLADLMGKIAKTLLLQGKPFSLKYQLPNEDLDSLISLAGDEDLDIMIEEYDRICSAAGGGGGAKGSRLRLFVFPPKLESSGSSIGSLLDGSVKSDEWFLSALNGSRMLSGGFSDTTSVNCLLGLENDEVAGNNNDLGLSRGLDSEFGNGKIGRVSNQEIHSVPDSPMMETTSSFGSMNSTPSMANLPPIRVRENDGGIRAQDWGQDQVLGIEEQYAQIRASAAAENFDAKSSAQSIPTQVAAVPPIPTSTPVYTQATAAAGDNASRVVSDDERSDHGIQIGFNNKLPQSQVQQHQKPGGGVDSPKTESLLSDSGLQNATPKSNLTGYQEVEKVPSGENKISANQFDQKSSFLDPNQVQVQLQKQVQESTYIVQPQIPQHQQAQQYYPYQQQFIQGGTPYVIQQPGNPMPMPGYYPVYPPQQEAQHPHHQPIPLHPQQYPIYIVQAPQPLQGYNIPMKQATYPEGTTMVHTGHQQTPSNPNGVPESATAFNIYPNVSKLAAPNLEPASAIYRTTATAGAQPQSMVQVAPEFAHQQFVNYSQVNHQPPTAAPSPAYSYEIPDPARAQIYFTQPLAPSLISQYQTMASAQGLDASNQPQKENINPSQVRNL